jgi:hypothetical protein
MEGGLGLDGSRATAWTATKAPLPAANVAHAEQRPDATARSHWSPSIHTFQAPSPYI